MGRWLCLGGATLGALGLIGSLLGAELLTTIVPGGPAMTPLTGLCLLLIGSAGALRYRSGARGVRGVLSVLGALVVLALAGTTLVEYALAVELLPAMPPSPPSALPLTLLAAALLVFDVRPAVRFRPSEWLVVLAGLTALAALVGLVFGAGPLYRLARRPAIGVALPTAIAILLVAVGMLLERPAAGVMGMVTSPGPGGVLLRRLALPATLVPVLLGLTVIHVLRAAGIQELAVVIAVLAVAMAAVTVFLLGVTAARLNRTHRALETSRTRTRSLVDQAPDGVFVADLSGRYIDVNAAGCRMLGYTRDELVGKTILDLLTPDQVALLAASKTRLLSGGPEVGEWRLRRKDGGYLPVEVSARILPDGQWQGLVRDITDRKQLEEKLRVAQAKASGILSISADAIISVDADQRITLFNEGAEAIFGYSRAEAIGAPLELLIPERFRAIHRRHVASFAAGPVAARRLGTRRAEIRGLRKSGEEFPADAAISRLEVAGTTILTVALRDVSEQMRAQHEQRFLSEFGGTLASVIDYDETVQTVARLIVGELADACLVDALARSGRIERVVVAHRDPARAVAARELEEIELDRSRPYLGSAVFETREPVVLTDITSAYLDSIAQSDAHRRALHELGPRSLVALPLVAHGAVVGSLVLIRTSPGSPYAPSDLPFLEEVAVRAAFAVEKARLYRIAQRAVQTRDDVLGIVAHDLRNPLGTILIQASLMRLRRGEPERPGRDPAEVIERAANRMSRLIQDLLDVASMEAGRLSVEQDRVSPRHTVLDAIRAQEPRVTSAALELRIDLAPELPDVWADQDRLLQVFENLIGNAIKFTPTGGHITVGAAPRAGEVRFWVGDSGIGIAAEHLPHVFDRFWQAEKGGRHGAGLGLPIVKGIVEAHGGRIWVESSPGEGSTFYFTIPAAPRAEPRRAGAEAHQSTTPRSS